MNWGEGEKLEPKSFESLVSAAKHLFEYLLYLSSSAVCSRDQETRKKIQLGGKRIKDADAKPPSGSCHPSLTSRLFKDTELEDGTRRRG